jgi:hypothetical protein
VVTKRCFQIDLAGRQPVENMFRLQGLLREQRGEKAESDPRKE